MSKLPTTAAQLNRAMQLHRRGDIGSAAQIYRQIVDHEPANADAWQLLGVIARQTGKHDLALQLLSTALQHNPRHAPALANHAILLRESGDLTAARRQAEAGLRADPACADVHSAMGGVCQAERDYETALRHFRRALQLQPGQAELYNNIAAAEQRLDHLPAAYAAITEALRLDPEAAHFYNTRGNILRTGGYPDLACADFAEAARRDPSLTGVVINEALARLLTGDFTRGWELFARRGKPDARYATLPLWNGDPIPQGTLLLAVEQGLGDTLQFVRLIPWAAARAGQVVLEVQPPLRELMASSFPDIQTLAQGDPLPGTVTHYCRLMELARLMQLGADNIPGAVLYLKTPPTAVPPVAAEQPVIGLVWAGNPDHLNDAKRSLRLEQLRPVLEPYQRHIVSLQKGKQAEELRQTGFSIIDGGAGLDDFTATAALLSKIDLLITADTSVAHLAGALGRPVWIMLPYDPDWRWQLERRDVPWYPTAKLYRQPAPGDWGAVLAEIGRDLAVLMQGGRAVLTPPAWKQPVPGRQGHGAAFRPA